MKRIALALWVTVIGIVVTGMGLMSCVPSANVGRPATEATDEPVAIQLTRTAEAAAVQTIEAALARRAKGVDMEATAQALAHLYATQTAQAMPPATNTPTTTPTEMPVPPIPTPIPPTVTPTMVLPGWGQGRIAFVRDRDGNNEIYVMKAGGTGQTRLTRDPGDDWSPAWSPDGRSIAFTSTRDAVVSGMHNIYLMNADGSNVVRLTYNQAWDEYAAWSPDGQSIAFVSTADDNAEIFIVNTDGSDYRRVTYNRADDINPTWSPDGGRLAFASRRTGTWQIFVMNADGSDQIRLTHSEAKRSAPSLVARWNQDSVLFRQRRKYRDLRYEC